MLSDQDRRALEDVVHELLERGQPRQAAERVIRGYGPEICGLFARVLGDDRAATDDAFSLFCEAVWMSLPAFEWRASLRTWVYVLARRALSSQRRNRFRQRGRERPFETHEVSGIAAEVRDETRSATQLARADRLAVLRASLGQPDQLLLILRIDRGMSWPEIATIVLPDTTDTRRAAATLRKRYERVTTRLRELAEQHGLVERREH